MIPILSRMFPVSFMKRGLDIVAAAFCVVMLAGGVIVGLCWWFGR